MEGVPGGMTRRQALKITAVAGLSLGLGGGVAAALWREAGLHRVRSTRIRMGTPVTLTVLHSDAASARELVERAFGEMERLEEILSRYRPHTPLSTLNREGVLHAPPEELERVLGRALELAERSRGAFDPTVAPLLELNRRHAGTHLPPDQGELARARELVDFREVRREEGRIALLRPGMALTLDGIAKGFVVDRVVGVLVAGGADRVLVDAGGDMASSPGASLVAPPWTVALQHPRDPGGTLGEVQLQGGAVASSGDYVQRFSADGTLHHIIDPRTGVSPPESAGVSVLAATAMDADALSTAAFVLGPTEGTAFLEAIPGVEGMVATREGGTRTTSGFPRRQG
jgi:FAD:protein FMN transferase